MSFLDQIVSRLEASAGQRFLTELRENGSVAVTGRDLLSSIAQARRFLSARGLRKGDRVALLAGNGIRWMVMDLAIIAEGLIVVPLYSRQAPSELVTMMKDCSPRLICCGDAALRDSLIQAWPEAPPQVLFDEIFPGEGAGGAEALTLHAVHPHQDSDLVAIIYTSGTSGEPKGVMISSGNVAHILKCTSDRLDILMNHRAGQDRVYQWAPLNFAAAWITTLTGLLRGSSTFMNTDLNRIAKEIREVQPDYFVNVPALLERVRRAVDEQIWKTGGVVRTVYAHAKAAYMRRQEGKRNLADSAWLAMANQLVFPTIRKKMIGSNVKALISGSAPLNLETQLYFKMLGIPVLQVYGLTETTAICTMDDPRNYEVGRVGPAVPGIEMKLGENDEILVRGPNVFPGYWNRPEESAKVLREGWFHTGDQGELSPAGNWKISGRIKNLIILNSGHNIAPEPIEDELLNLLPNAQHVVLVGNGRSYLSAIVTGSATGDEVQSAISTVNSSLPHYKQVRSFRITTEEFTAQNGLLTANGKLKRDAIAGRFTDEIEEMYRAKKAV
ncbi:MAG TPA: AMP-binding protein [Terriglobales bacterium]|jgi:long-chain acyl-CoA synthetase|nr:AMP-binding protein [Terriglobales bacterium]